jgi:penicillin V acylase-like amidase (Ntn superfamily)
MIKKITATFLVCIMAIYSLNACTTFVIKDSKNLVYGRNFDWDIAS